MNFQKKTYVDGVTVIPAKNLNDIQDTILEHEKQLASLAPLPGVTANALKGYASGNPVCIDDSSTLEHEMKVKAESKNLLPFPYPEETTTGEGVTFTSQADGGINATGTATGQKNFSLYYGDLLADGVITFSLSGEFTNLTAVLLLKDEAKETLLNRNIETSYTVNLAEYPTAKIMEIIIKRKTNAEVSGTVYPQLEKGAAATAYSRFIANEDIAVTKHGKNLLSFVNYENDATYTKTSFEDGLFRLESKAISSSNNIISSDLAKAYYNGVPVFPAGTYFFTADQFTTLQGKKVTPQLNYSFIDGSGTGAIVANLPVTVSKPFKLTDIVTPSKIDRAAGYVYESYFQLECGSAGTDWELFKSGEPHTADKNGNVSDIMANGDPMTLIADGDASLYATYNRDINKAFAELEQKISAMSAAILNN